MTSKEHKKHTHLAKASYGLFSRNEWSIVGLGYSETEMLAKAIMGKLSPDCSCGYAATVQVSDGAFKDPENQAWTIIRTNGGQHDIHSTQVLSRFGRRLILNGTDLVLINAPNHTAKAQILVLNDSSGGIQQPGNLQLLLTVEQDSQVPDVVKESIAGWQQLPILPISDVEGIAAFIRLQLQKNMAPLKGLVLAGGRSSRMGFDKSSLSWHGKEQRIYMADLLQRYCEEVFISCLPGQFGIVSEGYKTIEDSFTGLGPYGAILSAFREHPDAAWLVVACDLPMLDDFTLRFLTQNRNSSRIATTFQSPAGGFPEPLITIWEPASYPLLLSLLSQGYSCPRKALESNPVNMLQVPDKTALINVNTPAEKEQVELMLKSRGQQAFTL